MAFRTLATVTQVLALRLADQYSVLRCVKAPGAYATNWSSIKYITTLFSLSSLCPCVCLTLNPLRQRRGETLAARTLTMAAGLANRYGP